MAESQCANNELFYDALATMLQNPPTEFWSSFYQYGQTSGGLYFKLTDYPGMWLVPPAVDEQQRRAALREGRAWLTLQEGRDASMFQSDENLIPPEYSIVRPGGLIGGVGHFVIDGIRESLGAEPPADQPVVYVAGERRVVPDPLEIPFLLAVYNHATTS